MPPPRTAALYPRLESLGVEAGDQLAFLVSTLVLGGVLGAELLQRLAAALRRAAPFSRCC